jgi:hypothetical protein
VTRRRLALALVCLAALALAGCAAPSVEKARPDPANDTVGWEGGYWHDDRLDVDGSDGLGSGERRAVVRQAMARVEYVRGLEFTEGVSVEVISREQYRERNVFAGRGPPTYEAWRDQVWEGAFLVGEDRTAAAAFNRTYGASVVGYYSPGRGDIVLVSDAAAPTVDESVLAHELVHALQDQRGWLGRNAGTHDGRLARTGLVEGDATAVQRAYMERCGEEWRCLDAPSRQGGAADYDRGLFLAVYAPYAEGPGFVEALRERGNWSTVNAAYADPPVSTEQVIHPERYPADTPESVSVPDRSSAAWSRFDIARTGERLGEATIYAMLWANGVVDREGAAVYNYSHSASTGWAGDRLVPYRDGDRFGYVWQSEWDTAADAREFAAAYREVLAAHDARERGEGVYVVPESDPFGDAFRVSRSGTTVTVVNAPDTAALAGVHDG